MTAIHTTLSQTLIFDHQLESEARPDLDSACSPALFDKTWEFLRDMATVDDEELMKRKRQWRLMPCRALEFALTPC